MMWIDRAMWRTEQSSARCWCLLYPARDLPAWGASIAVLLAHVRALWRSLMIAEQLR